MFIVFTVIVCGALILPINVRETSSQNPQCTDPNPIAQTPHPNFTPLIEDPEPDPVPSYEEELKDWIDRLEGYESNGRHRIKILDVNGKYSYGCLQFQMATFVSFADMFDIDVGDPNETIFDCELQRRLALLMILDDYSRWRNWYTSVVKKDLGYPPKP